MNNIKISIAQLSDIPDLSALLELLFQQELEFKPEPELQKKGLSMIIENPQIGIILLCKVSGKPAGMVNLLFTVSTAKGAKVCILEDMVVKPEFRGLGIGSRLLDAAIQYAKEQHVARITLLTDKDNLPAQNFYAKQGFNLSSMVPMRLNLTE